MPTTYTHLKSKHQLYRKWSGMITRTTNKNEKSYVRYGGRGIKVFREWRENFIAFYNWAIENGYKEGLTLDRIDVNGDYTPENCQWISMKENTIKDRHSTYLEREKAHEICDRYISEHITVTKLAEEYSTYKECISKILKSNNIKIKNRRMQNVTKNKWGGNFNKRA